MPTQVYAVAQDGQGNFLIASKNYRGYFFHTPGGGGQVYPAGMKLNGGGNYAFPGGRLEADTPEDGAALEFQEETNVQLQSYELKPPAYHGIENQKLDYYGVYFQVSPPDLTQLESTVQDHLNIGSQAAKAVIAGTFGNGQYDALMAAFPGSPADNELDSMLLWNLDAEWQEIQTWKGNPTLGWFYNILLNLKDAVG